MLLLGANEAGKGSVVGSMFEAGLFVEEDRLFDLAGWGGQGLQAALASKEGGPGQEDSLHCLGSVHPGSQTPGDRRASPRHDQGQYPDFIGSPTIQTSRSLIVSSWKWNY